MVEGDLLHLVNGQLRSIGIDYAGSSASSMPYVRENCKVEQKVVELIPTFLLSEFSLIKLFNYLTKFLNTIIYIAVQLVLPMSSIQIYTLIRILALIQQEVLGIFLSDHIFIFKHISSSIN